MKLLKFNINEDYYNEFKEMCIEQDITIKRKLNVLLAQDTSPSNIQDFFPDDYTENIKSITLKVNEELYKGVMKNCGKYDFNPKKYLPYLIYKYLKK